MMPASLHDSPNDARCLCWLSADNLDARAATSDWCGITTKTRKIPSCKTPAARSRSQSCSCYEVKGGSLLPRCITRAPEPTAIPIARGTATPHITRFRALALFGRRLQQRGDRPPSRRPKTCTRAEGGLRRDSDQPGSRPFDFRIEVALGEIRNSMKALAAFGALAWAGMTVVKAWNSRISAGKGPTNSTPGA